MVRTNQNSIEKKAKSYVDGEACGTGMVLGHEWSLDAENASWHGLESCNDSRCREIVRNESGVVNRRLAMTEETLVSNAKFGNVAKEQVMAAEVDLR